MAPRKTVNKLPTARVTRGKLNVTNEKVKVEPEFTTKKEYDKQVKVEDETPRLECPICMANLFVKHCQVTMCGHLYCGECLQVLAVKATGICSICNTLFYKKSLRTVYLP